jgi:hypothetical protein
MNNQNRENRMYWEMKGTNHSDLFAVTPIDGRAQVVFARYIIT